MFGLGVTLGECLTGDLAYGDEASWDGGWRRRARLQRRFTRRLGRLPAGVADVVLSCLAPDPADRPTLAELKPELAAWTER